VTVAQNNAGRRAARPKRADRFAKRLAPKSLIMREFEIARRFRFVRNGEIDGFLELRGVHLRLFRRASRPVSAGGKYIDCEKALIENAKTKHK
jgi:hypothetical protein